MTQPGNLGHPAGVITVQDIIRHIEQIAGHALHGEEGVMHGSADAAVTGVTVAWMATPDAIEAAGRAGHNLLIVHESLFFPYNIQQAVDPSPEWKSWPFNRQRRELLDRHGLTCLRVHCTADELTVLDTFAETLQLGKPVINRGFTRMYEIKPRSFDELVRHVKRCTGMPAIRVAPGKDPKRPVRRIGLPWGGLGLFVNVSFQQSLVELGCDAFIAGETDNYGFRFALESGIPMIETSHEVCENPGLARFTERLQQGFPAIPHYFHENACIWQIV